MTRNGDVYRANLDKTGDARRMLGDVLPSVTEARAIFEIDREQTAALWTERKGEHLDRMEQAEARPELRQTDREA